LPGVHNDLFDALFRAGDRLRTILTRHEQGAAYMALGAALATGAPQVYTVVPGPGLLNTGAALLTAYSMNAPVLALIGQIPAAAIGRGEGHLHEIRDQAGIIARWSTLRPYPRTEEAAGLVAGALCAMARAARPGCAGMRDRRLGTQRACARNRPAPPPQPPIDEEPAAAAERLSAAKRPLIVAGGGAQGASAEVTELSRLLQAPVLAYRRGRGCSTAAIP
jgi:acetolactate synthase-1/2/3 large subunit